MSSANSIWTNGFRRATIAICLIFVLVNAAQCQYHVNRLLANERSLASILKALVAQERSTGLITDSPPNDTAIPASFPRKIVANVNAQTPLLYTFNFPQIDQNTAIRVEVSSTNATFDYPILISTRQREDILSWTLPFIDYKAGKRVLRPKQKTCHKRGCFAVVGRTLCPEHIVNGQRFHYNRREVSVELVTKSQSNVKFNMEVSVVEDFELKFNETATIQVAAAQPKYYMHTFPDGVDDLVIRLRSNSSTCMTVSVQKIKCPILDMERNIEFDGKFQTMTRQSTLTLERNNYKLNGTAGFFLVVVVHSTNDECTGDVSAEKTNNKPKVITVEFSKGLSSSTYGLAIGIPLLVFLVIGVLVAGFFSFKRCMPCSGYGGRGEEDKTVHTKLSTLTTHKPEKSCCFGYDANKEGDDLVQAQAPDLPTTKPGNDHLSNLTVIALFYALPAIQLVVTYLRVFRDSGDEDLCYYNYACANPAMGLTSFNNVFSNIGYVLLGITFIFIVWRRKCILAKDRMYRYGVRHDYGMFGALGFALMMEGVMSGTYHICPNSYNFQFDTSFMYLMASVAILKLYQNRHSDIVPTATKTYLCVGGYILLSVLLMLFNCTITWLVFMFYHVFCTLVFLVQYVGKGKWSILCYKDENTKSVCNHNNWSILARSEYDKLNKDQGCGINYCCSIFIPFVFLVLPNVGGAVALAIIQPIAVASLFLWAFVGNLAVYLLFYIWRKWFWTRTLWWIPLAAIIFNVSVGAVMTFIWPARFDISVISLLVLNLLIYFVCYVVCKCKKQTCPGNPLVIVMMIIVLALWAMSLYYFKQYASKWEITPAASRAANRDCISALFDFYDIHDLWHFLSAISLFLSFVVMLVFDDDVSTVDRDRLDVF